MAVTVALPLVALDPIDRVYVDLAATASGEGEAEDGASIHSPVWRMELTQGGDPPPLVVSPELAVVVMSVAADGMLFVAGWVGDRRELYTWTLTGLGTEISPPATLEQVCALVAEQVAGSWIDGEERVAPVFAAFAALALDGDRVTAGFDTTFEPQSGGGRGLPGLIAQELVSRTERLSAPGGETSIVLVPVAGEPDEEIETWDAEGEQSAAERLDDLRSNSLVEISVDADGDAALVVTGPAGTAVITELTGGRVCMRESACGALAEVMALVDGAGFAGRAGAGAAEHLAELFLAAAGDPEAADDDGPDEGGDQPGSAGPRELVITVSAELDDGTVTLERLLFVEAPDGCYLVDEPAEPGPDGVTRELRLMAVSRRGVLGRVAASLRH